MYPSSSNGFPVNMNAALLQFYPFAANLTIPSPNELSRMLGIPPTQPIAIPQIGVPPTAFQPVWNSSLNSIFQLTHSIPMPPPANVLFPMAPQEPQPARRANKRVKQENHFENEPVFKLASPLPPITVPQPIFIPSLSYDCNDDGIMFVGSYKGQKKDLRTQPLKEVKPEPSDEYEYARAAERDARNFKARLEKLGVKEFRAQSPDDISLHPFFQQKIQQLGYLTKSSEVYGNLLQSYLAWRVSSIQHLDVTFPTIQQMNDTIKEAINSDTFEILLPYQKQYFFEYFKNDFTGKCVENYRVYQLSCLTNLDTNTVLDVVIVIQKVLRQLIFRKKFYWSIDEDRPTLYD